MFSRFMSLGFRSNTLKNGSRILGYSAQSGSAILDPSSSGLLSKHSGVEFADEDFY